MTKLARLRAHERVLRPEYRTATRIQTRIEYTDVTTPSGPVVRWIVHVRRPAEDWLAMHWGEARGLFAKHDAEVAAQDAERAYHLTPVTRLSDYREKRMSITTDTKRALSDAEQILLRDQGPGLPKHVAALNVLRDAAARAPKDAEVAYRIGCLYLDHESDLKSAASWLHHAERLGHHDAPHALDRVLGTLALGEPRSIHEWRHPSPEERARRIARFVTPIPTSTPHDSKGPR